MSNLFAAIGRVQLSKLDIEFAPKRQALFSKYIELLRTCNHITLLKQDPNAYIVPHIFSVRILNNRRSELIQLLKEANIPTGIHYKPNHLLTYYGNGKTKIPITEKVYNEILTLPLHPDLKISEVEYICKTIIKHLNN